MGSQKVILLTSTALTEKGKTMADCNKCIHLPVCSRLIYCLVNEEVVCNHYLETKQATIDENKQWIPVSERLPEPNVPVLAYVRSKKIVCVSYDDVMEYGDFVGTRCGCFTKGYVTHWMPLPEPIKEDN